MCGYPSGDLSFSFLKGSKRQIGSRVSPIMQFGRITGLMPFDVTPYPYEMQTDIVGIGGSSGSPIVDMSDGKVIGIAQRALHGGSTDSQSSVGLVYGITNQILHELPEKFRNYFDKNQPLDIRFETLGIFEQRRA